MVEVKILVVEDNEVMRYEISSFLRLAGFQVIEAENGQIALDLLKTECVSAVLTDCQMPVMDGITLVKTIREVGMKIPVICLSADSSNSCECLKAGADLFLDKAGGGGVICRSVNRIISKTNSGK